MAVIEDVSQLDINGTKYNLADATARRGIEELNTSVPASVSFTIPAEGWTLDQAQPQPYGYYYDIAVDGVTASDRAEITLSPDNAATATACGLCPTTETLLNTIRIRAISAPTAAMVAEYWIEKGKE